MRCFICRKKIDPDAAFNDLSYLRLPNGSHGYVHSHHHGVREELIEQCAANTKEAAVNSR